MNNYSATMFEDVSHECLLLVLQSLRDPDILKHGGFRDHEKSIMKVLFYRKCVDKKH